MGLFFGTGPAEVHTTSIDKLSASCLGVHRPDEGHLPHMTNSAVDSERTIDANRRLRWRLNRSALAFETSVLERLVDNHPGNIDFLVALGQAYARLRRHQRGLEVDRTLVARQPDEPTFRYNLACSLALTGDLNGACGELLQAITLGYRDFEHLLADDDLVALRRDNRFGLIRDRMAELTSPQTS